MEAAAAASSSSSSAGTAGVQAPWSVGWQVNERNIMWSDDLKTRLVKVGSNGVSRATHHCTGLETAKRQGVWPQPALPLCVPHPRCHLRTPTHFTLTMLLLQRVASQELHITEEELEQRLQQVFNLLPGVRSMRGIIPQNSLRAPAAAAGFLPWCSRQPLTHR